MAFEYELEEWRGAVAEMPELERVQACGHWWSRGSCKFCGEQVDE